MENNADFALYYRRLAFECIPRMAHGISRPMKMKSPDELSALRAKLSVYHFAV